MQSPLEAVAIAIHTEFAPQTEWNACPPEYHEHRRRQARAAIIAIAENVTDEMAEAGPSLAVCDKGWTKLILERGIRAALGGNNAEPA